MADLLTKHKKAIVLFCLFTFITFQQSGKKMFYVKIQELRIVMEGLPFALAQEIGEVPRKPSFYGNSQRRKLWESNNV